MRLINPERFLEMRTVPENFDLDFDPIINALSEELRADPYSVCVRKINVPDAFIAEETAALRDDDFYPDNYDCFYFGREADLLSDLQKARTRY